MKLFGKFLKEKRLSSGLKIKEISYRTKIDQAIISKIESGSRVASEKQLPLLASAYGISFIDVKKEYLVHKVMNLIQDEPNASEVLIAAESRIEYLTSLEKSHEIILSDELSARLLTIDQLVLEWKSRKPLKGTQLDKMVEYFAVQNTYESNRIEGNTLTYQETHLVINEGITIGGKSMREHLEAINHSEALDYLYDIVSTGSEIDRRLVLDLHRLILKTVDTDNAGRYRSVPVRISGSEHIPPQPFLLEKLMEEYFEHFSFIKRHTHPVIIAAEMHERLVSIHPFIDGNGRTARLVMNFILMSHGYPIIYLKGDHANRQLYYQALEGVQADNDPMPFYNLIIDRVESGLKEWISMI